MQYMRMWHDNSGKGKYQGWYCSYVIVSDLQTREKFVFLINKWFAVEEDDGQVGAMIKNLGCMKSLMALWLEEASQWYELYCHDMEVMSSSPSWVELGVYSTSVPSCIWTKHFFFVIQTAYVAQLMLFK